MKIFLAGWLFLTMLFPAHAQDSLQYDFFSIPVSAPTAADGQIDLRITGGTGPFTFYWSTGFHQENQSGLSAGTYFCTVVDGNHIPTKIFAEVHEPEAFNWTYQNTGDNHTILVPESSLQGVDLEPGDFIGVFYRLDYQMICGGYMEYTAPGNLAVTAWGDASMSPEKDGFSPEEPFAFSWFDASTQRQYFLQSEFDGENFPNLGYYLSNGISGLASLGNISQELATPLLNLPQTCKLFPNPANSDFTIQWNQNQSLIIQIRTIDGKQVFSKECEGSIFSISVDEWPEGVYLLTANGQKISKLIVLHN